MFVSEKKNSKLLKISRKILKIELDTNILNKIFRGLKSICQSFQKIYLSVENV